MEVGRIEGVTGGISPPREFFLALGIRNGWGGIEEIVCWVGLKAYTDVFSVYMSSEYGVYGSRGMEYCSD